METPKQREIRELKQLNEALEKELDEKEMEISKWQQRCGEAAATIAQQNAEIEHLRGRLLRARVGYSTALSSIVETFVRALTETSE